MPVRDLATALTRTLPRVTQQWRLATKHTHCNIEFDQMLQANRLDGTINCITRCANISYPRIRLAALLHDNPNSYLDGVAQVDQPCYWRTPWHSFLRVQVACAYCISARLTRPSTNIGPFLPPLISSPTCALHSWASLVDS
jgi:hypothetical protein